MADSEHRFRVEFADATKKEFRKLGHAAAAEILDAIQRKLTREPELYGEPLRKDLKGYFKLVVGQWRVIYHVERDIVTVLVLAVGKRAEGDRENIYDRLAREDLVTRHQELQRILELERSMGTDPDEGDEERRVQRKRREHGK